MRTSEYNNNLLHTFCLTKKWLVDLIQNNLWSFYLLLSANVSSYSHYVFSTLDHEDSGIITFEVNFNYVLKVS